MSSGNIILFSILHSIFFLITLEKDGRAQSLEFQKCFGGTLVEYPKDIIETNNGSIVIIGTGNSIDGDLNCNHGSYDGFIIKMDSLGNLIWKKCIGGTDGDALNSIALAPDGGFIIGGEAASTDGDITCTSQGNGDYLIIKTDSMGNIEWQKCYGGSGLDRVISVKSCSDGGYIAAGITDSNDGDVTGSHTCPGCGYDYWILKLDSIGNQQWNQAFGGAYYEHCEDITETDDSCFIVVGSAHGNSGDVMGIHGTQSDYWIIKISSTGQLLWQRPIGGFSDDAARSIVAVPGGGAIIVGEASSNDGDVSLNLGGQDAWVIKLDGSGNIIWDKSLGGSGLDAAYSICSSSNGYVILSVSSGGVCNNFYDLLFTEIDSSGNIGFEICFGGSDFELPSKVIRLSSNKIAAVGQTNSNDGDVIGNHSSTNCNLLQCLDAWVLKVNPLPLTSGDLIYPNSNIKCSFDQVSNLLSIYLLENSLTEALQIEAFDLNGRLLYNDELYTNPSNGYMRIPLGENLPNVFVIKVFNNEVFHTQKILKL